MKGLLNLLTLLAALLNLTTGCGLSGRGTGSRLLRLGAALAHQRLSSGSTAGGLAAVSAALGGSSGGTVLGGITSLSGGGLGDGLVNVASALTASRATTGLHARPGALRAHLGGGSQGSVLTDLKELAVQRLHASVSSGGSGSGTNSPVSGQQLGAGLVQTAQMASGGFLVAASTASNTATGIRTQLGRTPIGNIAGTVASPGSGTLLGVPSSQGTRPGASGVIPGAYPHQRPGQDLQNMGQMHGGGSFGAVNTVINTATSTGGHFVGSTARNVAGVPANPAGVGTLATLASGISESSSTVVASSGLREGPRAGPGARGTVPTAGTRGNFPGVPGTPSPGLGLPASVNPGQILRQSVQQSRQLVTGGLLTAAAATSNGATGLAENLGGNAIPINMAVVPRPGAGVPLGAPSGETRPGSSGVSPGVGAEGAGLGGAFPGNVGPLAETGLQGSSLSPGLIPAQIQSGSGANHVPGLEQGPTPNSQALGVTNIAVDSATLRSAARMGLQTIGSTTERILGVNSRDNAAVPGVGTPTAGIGGSPNGVLSGPGIQPGRNIVQGLGQGASQMSQVVNRAISEGSSAALHTTTSLGVHTTGSSRSLQGIASTLTGAASGVGAPIGGFGPGPNGPTSGWNPGQSAQPNSQPRGGGSFLSVSSSRQSSSSYHAQMVGTSGTSSLGSLPTSPGGGGSGSVVTSGGGNLLGAILRAGTGGAPQSSLEAVGAGGLGVAGSSVASGTLSSNVVSEVGQQQQLPPRTRIGPAAAAGIAMGTIAGTIALSALGTGIANAIHSSGVRGGHRTGGCPGVRRCSSGCGRRRRSVPLSKVPAEVLNRIPTNFDRLY